MWALECLGVCLQLVYKLASMLHQFKTFVTDVRATIAVVVSLCVEIKLTLDKNYQLLAGRRSDQVRFVVSVVAEVIESYARSGVLTVGEPSS